MTASEILRAARSLISDQACWTQGKAARSASGREVMPSSKRAVCWCAQGAVERVSSSQFETASEALEALRRFAPSFDPSFSEPFEVNDVFGHEATLQMFDLAIASVECRS